MAKRRYFRAAQQAPRAVLESWPTVVVDDPTQPSSLPDSCSICQDATGDLVADHCHKSGVSREWICRRCNTGLGMFRDNPDALERAAAYIRKHQAGPSQEQWVRAQYRQHHPRAVQ